MAVITLEQLGTCASGDHYEMNVTVNGFSRDITIHISDILRTPDKTDAEESVLLLLQILANGATEQQVRNKLTGTRNILIDLGPELP